MAKIVRVERGKTLFLGNDTEIDFIDKLTKKTWNDAISVSLNAIMDELVDEKATKQETDHVYNTALQHAFNAIQKLRK